jgi:succinyl-diaminopimelate desuccinylase
MNGIDVIDLTRKLLSFNTVNPPGNEASLAQFTAELLNKYGFETELQRFDENRLHLIAGKGLTRDSHALVLSGHYDTVPLGAAEWSEDPWGGSVNGDRLFGRGSSDMKAGLAAMIAAAVDGTMKSTPREGLRLIFTAGEELGCQGITQLSGTYKMQGKAGAVVIGEPTANIPAVGHKGALYLNAVTTGKTAHSSMPDRGINAIYKAAHAIIAAEKLEFGAGEDPLLGFPTINVGKIKGGMNINSVPDHAEFTIDVRSTRGMSHQDILIKLSEELGPDVSMEVLVDLGPVATNENDEFVQLVYRICKDAGIMPGNAKALPYVTDGSVLQNMYPGAPVVILGPGQPEMAHKTDEFCYISKILQAKEIYQQIIQNWRNQ